MKSLQEEITIIDNQLSNAAAIEACKLNIQKSKLQQHIAPTDSIKTATIALEQCQILNNQELEMLALITLGKSYYNQMQFATAITYHQQALELATENKNDTIYYLALQNIEACQSNLNKELVDIKTFQDCQDFFISFANEEYLLENINYLAALHLDKDFATASNYCIRGINLAKEKDFPIYWAEFSGKLFYASQKAGDIENALKYFDDYYSTFEKLGAYNRIIGSGRIAAKLYQQIGNETAAKEILQKEIHVTDKIGSGFALAIASDIYKQQGEFDKAVDYAKRAVEAAKKSTIVHEMHFTLHGLASAYFSAENYIESINTFDQLFAFQAEKINNNNKIKALAILHQAYQKVQQFDKAYETVLQLIRLEKLQMDEERMKEIATLNAKYESEKKALELKELKIKQQQTEIEVSESELKALKAQMNPHFIFNALNSIQELFFLGDKRLANEHLGKFSDLTRKILATSSKKNISLEEEMDMLEKYLSLESMRFVDNFEYQMQCHFEENLIDEVMLPPMLLQPYIENAIKHGLMHITENRKLQIDFYLNEADAILICEIKDNGIGRQKSATINASKYKGHESFSTSANAKRLALLNQNKLQKIGVEFQDLEPGTKVIITVPIVFQD